jgi:hypothetical protein
MVKKIDLGEYVVNIDYDPKTSNLTVSVLDELGDIIDALIITDDDDDDDDDDEPNKISLN